MCVMSLTNHHNAAFSSLCQLECMCPMSLQKPSVQISSLDICFVKNEDKVDVISGYVRVFFLLAHMYKP